MSFTSTRSAEVNISIAVLLCRPFSAFVGYFKQNFISLHLAYNLYSS